MGFFRRKKQTKTTSFFFLLKNIAFVVKYINTMFCFYCYIFLQFFFFLSLKYLPFFVFLLFLVKKDHREDFPKRSTYHLYFIIYICFRNEKRTTNQKKKKKKKNNKKNQNPKYKIRKPKIKKIKKKIF